MVLDRELKIPKGFGCWTYSWKYWNTRLV